MKKLETLGFKHFCMTIGNLPSSYVESLSYYECLMWLCKYLQDTVIPTVNNNSEAVTELQDLYIQLKSYVDNYFENLDVQEEINNKLDSMVESGQIQEIISAYLNSKAIFGYDNVEDMKDATNLIDGSYAHTLGYYEKNDGGGSLYKITETLPQNVYYETLDNGLYAILIIENDEINIKQLGAYGDNIHNDANKIQYALTNYSVTLIPVGTFLCGNTTLTIPRTHTLRGIDKNNSILKYNGTDIFIKNEDAEDNNFIVIENLKIQGVDKHGIGICLNRTASVDGYGASWHRLTGLIIGGFETGLEVRKNQNETQFSDIHCRSNSNGIRVINGVSDMYFEKIVCSRNDIVGMYLFQVTETRFSDLKLWYNGSNSGAYNNLRIDSCNALMFVNLSLQDAFGNNCYITTSSNISMINSWFDTPQNETQDTCYQLKLSNVKQSRFNINGRNRKIDNSYVNKILQLDNDIEQCEIIFNCETDFPYSQLLNETNKASLNNINLKNTIIFQDKIINYNENLNFIVNGNLQDKTTLNFINSGKENCNWNGNLLRATAGESSLTLGFKTGKRNNLGLHTFYIKFDVISGEGNITFKSISKNFNVSTNNYMCFTAYFDNTNRSNGYLTLNIPANMVIDIYEIGCCENASAKLCYPLSLNSLT